MSRSIEQIRDAIRINLLGIDNRLDLTVGPLWDYLISPIPRELYIIESQVEALKRYYSPNFSAVATPQEARDFAINFGTGPSIGNFAKTTVVFYRNSPPGNGLLYTVPVGSLVRTIDGTLVFRTLQQITMSGDYASTYFNPGLARYEIQTNVEAIAPGELYNIPAGHIRTMDKRVEGFDGIEQISAATGGTEPENSNEVARRVQAKFRGLERNSMLGIETRVREFEPNLISAVSIVKPTDRMEFRRYTSSPALDVYLHGTNLALFNEDYLAMGGETSLPISVNRTVQSITTVAVNGSILDASTWAFTPDTSLEYQLSTRADSKIEFELPLLPNDLVEISGYKNELLDDIQFLFLGENSLFFTDILVRSFINLPIIVGIECRLTTGDPDTLREMITAYIAEYIEPTIGGRLDILIPDTIRSILREKIPEIEAIKILQFRRKIGSMDIIEIISPYKNQIPVFDAVASSITVRL